MIKENKTIIITLKLYNKVKIYWQILTNVKKQIILDDVRKQAKYESVTESCPKLSICCVMAWGG